MTTQDIKVGQKYTHKNFPTTTYLGCGFSEGLEPGEVEKFTGKLLVIVAQAEEEPDCPVGSIVSLDDKGFAEGFSEVE